MDIYVTEDDIRLKLSIYDNTLIRSIKNGKLEELIKKVPEDLSIGIICETKYLQELKKNIEVPNDLSKIYLLENFKVGNREINIAYSDSLVNFNKLLGAIYGNQVLIIILEKYNDELLRILLDNMGKFQSVIILSDTNKGDIGNEPESPLELGDSIVFSYKGFINYFQELNLDQLLVDTKGLTVLLFPTDRIVPNEIQQSIELTLSKVDIKEMMNDFENEEDIIIRCDIFTNTKFLEALMESFQLFMNSLGIFFIDNEPIVFDYNLFDEYVVKGKYKRVYEIFLRILICFDTFRLVAIHDNFKEFLINLINEYNLDTIYNDSFRLY